jgi:RNA polymerase sigma factor FliA
MDEQEKQLWEVYSSSRSTDDRNRLVELHMCLAHTIAKKYYLKVLGTGVDYGELLSAASEGLIQSVERFDLSRSILFRTFATQRIRGQIADWLRSTDVHTRLYRIREPMVRKWAQTLGHKPTDDEIYGYFGFKLERRKAVSLSSTGHERDDWKVRELNEWGVGKCDSNHSVGEVSYLLKGLTRRERLAVVLYCIEGYTMREAAEVIGVSESRMSQMMTDLIPRMRDNFQRAA